MGHVDRQLYDAWVDAHSPAMFRLAYRLCGRRDLAEDLVQETFYEAWKSRDNLAEPAKAKAWLCQILRHRWMHYLRDSARRIRPVGGVEALAGTPQGGLAGRDPAGTVAESDRLQRALDHVEPEMKLPLLLVVMEGYTCQEVADMLQLPLGTVLSRMHRAKQALREQLGEQKKVEAPLP